MCRAVRELDLAENDDAFGLEKGRLDQASWQIG